MPETYDIHYQAETIEGLLDKIHDLGPASGEEAGTMSAADKTKLDGIASGAQANVLEGVKLSGTALTPTDKVVNIPMDDAPTAGSNNPVKSGALKTALDAKGTYSKPSGGIPKTDLDSGVQESLDKADGALQSSGIATFAGSLVDTLSAGTPQSFTFRQSGGDGVNHIKRIKGRSEAWNQLVNPSTFAASESSFTSGVKYVNNADGSFSIIVDTGGSTASRDIVVGSHNSGSTNKRLYIIGNDKSLSSTTLQFSTGYGYYDSDFIVPSGSSAVFIMVRVYSNCPAGTYTFRPQVFNLTLMGIATAISTPADFHALYPELYYPYNSGKIVNNDAEGLESVGFNIWDEEWEVGRYDEAGGKQSATAIRAKNFIPAFPNTTYRITVPSVACRILYYDISKSFISTISLNNTTFTTPENCYYLLFSTAIEYGTTYKGDICINRSDASRNGTYQPYWKRDLAFKLKEVTGVPVGGSEADRVTIFPDGPAGVGTAQDVFYEENGATKAKRVMSAEVDLGDLTWDHSDSLGRFKTSSLLGIIKDGNRTTKMVCAKYLSIINGETFDSNWDKVVYSVSGVVLVHDSSFSPSATGQDFVTANTGVKLRYELATPIIYTNLRNADGTPFEMPKNILVDNLGTEKAVYPTHADGSPSAPFECDSNYSVGIANLVRRLNALENA